MATQTTSSTPKQRKPAAHAKAKALADALDHDRIEKDFAELVNMTAEEIEQWLQTPESRKVGWKGKDGRARESVGHASGRRIVSILRKDPSERDEADYLHMRKTAGFIRRHRAQEPINVATSRWRYSLMNWGHDPLKSTG